MCGIFGFSSYGETLSQKDAHSLVTSLGIASAERGTHATGISYFQNGRLEITKAPKAAYNFKFALPKGTSAVMGHTRHATQGDYKNNTNNHPFEGKAGKQRFTFAHNGIISNDSELRKSKGLPKTKIQTDSFIAVQLLNMQKSLDMNSIKVMSELIEGSYAFTILDNSHNLYLVKGSSPLSILHDKHLKIYIYASTHEILWQGIMGSNLFNKFRINLLKCSKEIEEISVSQGQILRISPDGTLKFQHFTVKETYSLFDWRNGRFSFGSLYDSDDKVYSDFDGEYVEQLRTTASFLGYDSEMVDVLLDEGYQFDEIEELLYSESLLDEKKKILL